MRKTDTKRYIDLVPLEEYGKYCIQDINFGDNLLNYTNNFTVQDVATAVIPLGERFDDEKRTKDAIEGLDEYLTIKSVNNNVDYVFNQSAVNRFGWVKVVKHWDDVTKADNLKKKATEWLKSVQFAKMVLTLNAVDLSLINANIDSFEVGDTIHAWAEPFGMDTTFPIRQKTISLNDISKDTIVLSTDEVAKSYTSKSSKTIKEIEEKIPEESAILDEAKNVRWLCFCQKHRVVMLCLNMTKPTHISKQSVFAMLQQLINLYLVGDGLQVRLVT